MLQLLTRHIFPHVSNCCTGPTHYNASCSSYAVRDNLSRMSRIDAVLLALHTASLLPLGTRVAVAAPVWLWRPPRHPPPESQCGLFVFEAPLRERQIESTSGQPHRAEKTASRAESVGERSSNTIEFGRCVIVAGGCSTCPLTHDNFPM